MSAIEKPSFDDYEHEWKRKHRSSIPRRVHTSSAREYFWIGFWLLVASGAAIFSAAHTIPAAQMTIFSDVPNRGMLAVTAFVIVELVIFGAAAGRREIKWLTWLLIGCILVALAGNVSSSIRAVTENGGDILNQFGGVLLAIIAPLTALAAGEVLHIQLDKRAEKQRIANDLYESKLKEVEATINREFTKHLKGFEISKPVPLSIPDHSIGTERNGTDNRPALGHSKNSNAWNEVMTYFGEHPEALARDGREIANELGVGKSTVYKARSEFQKANYSNGNGNGHHENGDN